MLSMKRRSLDSVELVAISVLSAMLGFYGGIVLIQHYEPLEWQRAAILGAEGAIELGPLATRYGSGRVSRNAEEWIVRDFFNDRRDGTFLDVGANDYREDSNTFYLETSLGWRGIAIDAQPEFAAGYAAHRPRTKFVTAFVSDVSDADVEFFVAPDHPLTASANRVNAESDDVAGKSRNHPSVRRMVKTTTLNDILAGEGLAHVDFVSMDIELHEPQGLAGFDIDRFSPALLCVEAHPSVRQAILDYFSAHRYAVVGKYLRMDTQNLYFVPADTLR
jgi:FkbM family methyltransferase